MNEIIIGAKPENLEMVQGFINEQLGACPPKIKNQINLAVDEIFSNISRYAYCHDNGTVTIRIAVEKDITIEFEDSGVAYDPLSAEEPDITLSAEERSIGGLGIFMVKKIMDSMDYRREDNKNILTIKKTIA